MKKMRCIKPNIGIIPSNIENGKEYWLDEDYILQGNTIDKVYGIFYHDSLKTEYAGLTEMERMVDI